MDTGFGYSDYNYARKPRTPYDPLFSALAIMNPTYKLNDIDVLADRNNLRVLLEFCQGKANGPFRLDIYSIFSTLVIVRNEKTWWKHADGKNSGYGGNFERFFTRPAKGMEDATSHYRAIRYNMGPLNVVCRFEADAYDDGAAADDLTAPESAAVSGGPTERPRFTFNLPMRVLQKGHIIPTAQMVELKTKSWRPEDSSLVRCEDQLWFGRTKLLYTGLYTVGKGVVKWIKYEDATPRVKKWENNNQDGLRRLVSLLTQLKAHMKRLNRPNHAVVLVREDRTGPLTIRAMEGKHQAISKDAFEKYWRRSTPQHAPSLNGYQSGGFAGQRGGGKGHHPMSRGGAGGNANPGNFSGGRGYSGGYQAQSQGRGYAGGYHAQSQGQGYSGSYQPQSHGRGYTQPQSQPQSQPQPQHQGQGYAGGGRGGSYAGRERGGHDGGGHGRTEGGRGGRGSGYERGGYGRGEPPARRPNY